MTDMNKFTPSARKERPFVSVIIPFYRDFRRLPFCLSALENQTYPRDLFEVIIVDNEPENPLKIDKKYSMRTVLLHEKKPGSYAARNKGIAYARGEILAFTDSDCIPTSGWIDGGVCCLRDSSDTVGIVGGRIAMIFKHASRPTLSEFFDQENFMKQEMYVKKCSFSVTANLFTFKRIAHDVNGFNDVLKSGGDRDFCNRVIGKHWQIRYADKAVICHPADNFWELCNKVRRITGGLVSAGYTTPVTYDNFLKQLRQCFLSLNDLNNIRKRKEIVGLVSKLSYAALTYYIHFLTLYEKVRLSLGHDSKR